MDPMIVIVSINVWGRSFTPCKDMASSAPMHLTFLFNIIEDVNVFVFTFTFLKIFKVLNIKFSWLDFVITFLDDFGVFGVALWWILGILLLFCLNIVHFVLNIYIYIYVHIDIYIYRRSIYISYIFLCFTTLLAPPFFTRCRL